MVDASQGGYYKTTDIENLNQAFSFGAIAQQLPENVIYKILKTQQGMATEYPDN